MREKKRKEDYMKLSKFEYSYIETALWSSIDDNGVPLDEKYSENDFADETLEQLREDCNKFQNEAGDLLDNLNETLVAHDFWLTRNHHGAGFWDGEYEKSTGKKLTELSHEFGECDLYVGDDGKLYIM